MTEPLDALRALPVAGLRRAAPYGLIRLRGRDSTEFLQRLCSQDIKALEVGGTAPAAFLDPKGKLVATAWIGRGEDQLLLSTQSGTLDRLAEMLDRYLFTEQVEIQRPAEFGCVEVRGPGAFAAVGAAAGTLQELGELVRLAGPARHGVEAVRWHGPPAALEAVGGELPSLDERGADLWRLFAAEALVGVDTEPTTLAMEVDLDDHISTTKGCYTGQEIVARIHTYGHVNRRLVRLHIDSGAPIDLKTPLCDAADGDPVGRVMTAAALPGGDRGSLALGFLPEAFLDEPEPLALGAAGGPAVQVVDGSFEPA